MVEYCYTRPPTNHEQDFQIDGDVSKRGTEFINVCHLRVPVIKITIFPHIIHVPVKKTLLQILKSDYVFSLTILFFWPCLWGRSCNPTTCNLVDASLYLPTNWIDLRRPSKARKVMAYKHTPWVATNQAFDCPLYRNLHRGPDRSTPILSRPLSPVIPHFGDLSI